VVLTHRRRPCRRGPALAGVVRRFDFEHTFRLFKQVLGWTAPKIRDPQAADRWTWLIITAHTKLRFARHPAADPRRPWERPAPPGRLTPARVRRGFRNIRAKTTWPAGAVAASPALGGRPARGTGGQPPVTTSGSTTSRTRLRKAARNSQVKQQV
jgi:hypothetical protein